MYDDSHIYKMATRLREFGEACCQLDLIECVYEWSLTSENDYWKNDVLDMLEISGYKDDSSES